MTTYLPGAMMATAIEAQHISEFLRQTPRSSGPLTSPFHSPFSSISGNSADLEDLLYAPVAWAPSRNTQPGSRSPPPLATSWNTQPVSPPRKSSVQRSMAQSCRKVEFRLIGVPVNWYSTPQPCWTSLSLSTHASHDHGRTESLAKLGSPASRADRS